jgi:hypothetical protein
MTTTYTYLKNAEQELRQALKNSVDTAKSYQLKRIAETINIISDISSSFQRESDPDNLGGIKITGEFFSPPPFVGDTYVFGSTTDDTITFGPK